MSALTRWKRNIFMYKNVRGTSITRYSKNKGEEKRHEMKFEYELVQKSQFTLVREWFILEQTKFEY